MGVPVSRQFATPAVNIIENDKQYDIQIAAPGMTKDDFKISINDNNELVINLEKIETETAKKIFDFLSGATYALNGNVQKIASNIFIFAPEKVDITTTSSQERAGFDFGANKSPWAR